MAETGFNPLGCTLYLQDSGSSREEEVKSDNELSFWEIQNCKFIIIIASFEDKIDSITICYLISIHSSVIIS